MTDELLNLVRREIWRAMSFNARHRVGIVSSYDPDNHAVKVKLQPEDIESGWIPITTQHIGNGYGVVMGPEIGDQLEVAFQGGDPSVGRIVGRLFSDQEKPPRVEAGEMLLKHKSGAMLLIDKDGKVSITASKPIAVKTTDNLSFWSAKTLHLHGDELITSNKAIVIGEGGHTAPGER